MFDLKLFAYFKHIIKKTGKEESMKSMIGIDSINDSQIQYNQKIKLI